MASRSNKRSVRVDTAAALGTSQWMCTVELIDRAMWRRQKWQWPWRLTLLKSCEVFHKSNIQKRSWIFWEKCVVLIYRQYLLEFKQGLRFGRVTCVTPLVFWPSTKNWHVIICIAKHSWSRKFWMHSLNKLYFIMLLFHVMCFKTLNKDHDHKGQISCDHVRPCVIWLK